jgi:predicted NBD/HSP70 family sugar kinase
MRMSFLDPPRVLPPLDPGFRPIAIARRCFRALVDGARTTSPLTLALEREAGQVSLYRTSVLADAHPQASANAAYTERLLKSLLWQRGARRVFVAGPDSAVRVLPETYSARGERAFDAQFFSDVYGQSFVVERVEAPHLPSPSEASRPLGGDLRGHRIGFDAGGSDCKVAAVVDGQTLYAEEFAWQPKEQSDPEYHVAFVRGCIEKARSHLQHLDAIGISSAGIYVNNEVRVASLFRRVARSDFEARIRNIYSDLGREWGVPVEVANDGDVAALAGAMELGRGPLLGLALGTSLAAGFVDSERRVLGWLNELAFAPNDVAENAPIDSEWSLDRGTAVQYLSQDAALRLALESGLELAPGTRAERLAELSRRAGEREPSALLVFESLGVYLGYALLDYTEFYGMRDVLLLGRVTSGVGGGVLVSAARHVLETEAPDLFAALNLHLPNEAQRRVGQAIAAASLPTLSESSETP